MTSVSGNAAKSGIKVGDTVIYTSRCAAPGLLLLLLLLLLRLLLVVLLWRLRSEGWAGASACCFAAPDHWQKSSALSIYPVQLLR